MIVSDRRARRSGGGTGSVVGRVDGVEITRLQFVLRMNQRTQQKTADDDGEMEQPDLHGGGWGEAAGLAGEIRGLDRDRLGRSLSTFQGPLDGEHA